MSKAATIQDHQRPKIKVMYESLLPSINEMDRENHQKIFLEFLKVNLNISVIACVDFTASNLYTPSRVSLHNLDPSVPNMY